MRHLRIIIALTALLTPLVGRAADKGGEFAMQGAGMLSCERFMEERKNESKVFWNIGGWIDGYLTGYNNYRADTYDITTHAPKDSASAFTSLLTGHCRENPEDRIGVVIKTLAQELHPIRLRKHSSIKDVNIDGDSYQIYEKTLTKMQRILQRRGEYDGEVDGEYGPKMRNALTRILHAVA